MHSTSKFFLILSISLMASASQATNKVGNGGNVVKCDNSGKPSVQLLDFYEHSVVPDAAGPSGFEIAKGVFNKLSAPAPKLANQYQKRLSQIQDEIDFKSEIQLLEIPDSKHLFKPLSKDCEILQVAVRNNFATSTEKKFLIRKDLWDQMPPVQQAGLLTHEILHEHLTKLGEDSSIKARRINAFLFTKNTKDRDFWKLIQELEVPIYP